MTTRTKKQTTTTTAPEPLFRFTVARATIETSSYGNPIPTLHLEGPGRDYRTTRAAALRAAADAEEAIAALGRLVARECSDVQIDVRSNTLSTMGATLRVELGDNGDPEAVRRALEVAGKLATGAASWAFSTQGERVLVSVPR